MENTESFNLRWDEFKANTCVVLKELREEREFCDVTLACDGKQVSAHKVILAGGSNFFQQILKQNPHPHPLLYLKGVRYEYLLSMLDFVYTGEANINEKELVSFLDVANDLQIKGLIEKNPLRKTSAKEGDTIRSNISHQNERSHVKKEAGSLPNSQTPSQGDNRGSLSTCEEGPLDVNIKVELDDTIHSTASFGMEANRAGLNDREDEDMIDFKTEVPNSYEIGSILKNEQMTADWYEQSEDFIDDALRPKSGKLAPVFNFPDPPSNCEENHDRNQVLVDDNVKTKPGVETDDFFRGIDKDQVFSDCDLTGREPVDSISKSEKNAPYSYEEGEESNVNEMHDGEPGENHNDKEFSTMTNDKEFSTMTNGKKVCSVCGKSFRNSSDLKVHTRTHTGEKPFPCLFCPKTFGKSSHLKEHTRIHTGEKPFQCWICLKRFTQSSRLNVHKKQKQCSKKLGE